MQTLHNLSQVAGEERDDLDYDLSALSDLPIDDLDHDLSDLSDLSVDDLSDVWKLEQQGIQIVHF